jgi:hypothetical protein
MANALRPIRPAIPVIPVVRQIDPSESRHDAREMAAPRPRAGGRRPVHLAIFVGLSAGAYAVSLAGVTALQAASVQAVSDGYAPTSDAIDLLKTHHDQLEARLQAATAAYNTAAGGYGDVSDSLKAYEEQLQALAKQVTKTKGSAVWVPPAGGGLPSVGRVSATTSKPVSHAKTCASGKPCP